MRIWLLKRAVFLVQSAGTVTVQVWTDLPDDDMAVRHTQSYGADTTKARDIDVRMPGSTRARMVRFEITSTGPLRIHAGWYECRPMDGGNWTKLGIAGLPGQLAGWQDMALPIPPHPKTWAEIPLPIAGQPKEWSVLALPIAERPKDWADIALPIAERPKAWADINLPIAERPKDWADIALPIAERPKVWADINLPIPERPKVWTEQPIPMYPTPEAGTWAELPADA